MFVRDIEADDFAFAANGDLYVAENPPSRIVRVGRTGRRIVVAGPSDGLDNPSAVAFGATAATRSDLYITNAAYFGSHPSLQQMRLAR